MWLAILPQGRAVLQHGVVQESVREFGRRPHHFSVLKEADLITSRREGQQIFYSLKTTVMQDTLTILWDMFGRASGEEGKKR